MKNIFTHTAILSFLLLPLFSRGAECGPGSGILCNPIRFDTIYEFLDGLLGLVIAIGFPVIVLFIVYIGFRFVQASATGAEQELKDAKKNLWYALIGALILLGAQALSLAIQGTVEGLSRGL